MTAEDIRNTRVMSNSSIGPSYDYFSKKLEDKIMERMKIQMDALYKRIEEKICEIK